MFGAKDNAVRDEGFPRPTLFELSPEFKAAQDKLMGLIGRREELQAEIKSLRSIMSRDGEFGALVMSIATGPAPEPKPILVSSRAAALLGPELTPSPYTPEPRQTPKSPNRQRMEKLASEHAAVIEAIAALQEVAPGQRLSVHGRLFQQASQKRCDALRPEYAVTVARYLDALTELGRATVAYNRFTGEVLRGTAWAGLRPLQLPVTLGNPLDPQSEFRQILNWAVECGHLSDVPAEFVGKEFK